MSKFTFVVIATLEPGDGVSIPDPLGVPMTVLDDGSLMLGTTFPIVSGEVGAIVGHDVALAVKRGTVGKVVVWAPRSDQDAPEVKTGAVFAPGKTDGKWWEWNGAKWIVIDPLRALPGLLV